MKEQIEKLKGLGMTPKEAMLFMRDIANHWYSRGMSVGIEEIQPYSNANSFDTLFSKALNQ